MTRLCFLIVPVILYLLCLFTVQQATAQSRYTDSLQAAVKQADIRPEHKVMALCELADIIRFSDTSRAAHWAEDALQLARQTGSSILLARAYGCRAFAFLSRHNFEASHKNMDSCLMFAGRSADPLTQSWAWYRKGRMLSYENHTREAIDVQLKALAFIKNKEHYAQEAAIYYALYGAFSTFEDLDNQDKYALLALSAAQKGDDPNRLCEAWQAIATGAEYRYQQSHNKTLLDSALRANKTAITVYRQHEPYMRMVQLLAIPAINTANLYLRYYPAGKASTDSLMHYVSLAFSYAGKDRNVGIQAAALGIMNEDAQRNGRYDQAEQYLVQSLSLLLSENSPNYHLLASVHQGLSMLAERNKDYEKALGYYKAFKADHDELYDISQASAGKELEARFEAKEKAQQIRFLEEREVMHKRLRYGYAGIALALLTGLVFMFRSYHFRLRYALQKEKMLQQEKEEARLLARLKEEEALVLETEKQKAELHARLQEETARLKEEEAARLLAEQQAIQARNETLQKEALASSLHAEQKHKVLLDLKNRFDENPGKELSASELNKLLRLQQHMDSDYENLKTELKDIHPEFYNRLQARAAQKLTSLDLKYCAYICLNRSTQEMANLFGVEAKSIRMSKYRIKQKLGLEKSDDLEAFLRNLV